MATGLARGGIGYSWCMIDSTRQYPYSERYVFPSSRDCSNHCKDDLRSEAVPKLCRDSVVWTWMLMRPCVGPLAMPGSGKQRQKTAMADQPAATRVDAAR